MRRQSLVTGAALAALLLSVSACGGSDDKADPKPTKTSASPTPTTPVQPKGADGVTIDIQNWDAYAADPAVLAWKQTTELFSASSNQGRILEGMRAGYSEAIFRQYARNLEQYVWKNDWHVIPTIPAKVQESHTNGSKANLVTCLWAPSYALRKKNGALVAKTPKEWISEKVELTSVSGRWVITKTESNGTCPGGAPV